MTSLSTFWFDLAGSLLRGAPTPAPTPAAPANPTVASCITAGVCTFKATGKEYAKQYWYTCSTCNQKEGEGVCAVCKTKCHAGHLLSDMKYTNFFCDCGAAGSGSCKCLN